MHPEIAFLIVNILLSKQSKSTKKNLFIKIILFFLYCNSDILYPSIFLENAYYFTYERCDHLASLYAPPCLYSFYCQIKKMGATNHVFYAKIQF